MATKTITNLPGSWLSGLFTGFLSLIASLKSAGAILHNDEALAAEKVTAAPATDVATTVALANDMKARMNEHIAQTTKHLAADAANGVTSANATDQTTANTLLNEIKGDFNAHHKSATYHNVGGAGGFAAPADVATANATDAATSQALANALKTAMNLHICNGAPTYEVKGN